MIISSENMRKKKNFDGDGGGITIFLSITLLLIITLTGMLVDGARIKTGEATVKRAADNAIHSALSHYDKTLKEDYGLFALAIPEEQLEEFINRYIDLGLNPRGYQENLSGFGDLYSFNIEGIGVRGLYSLGEDEVLEQQILEFMKYRGPKVIAEEFVEKLVGVSKAGEFAEIMKDKMEVEGQLNELAHLEKELEKLVQQVKNFNQLEFHKLGEGIYIQLNNLINLQSQRVPLREQLNELNHQLARAPIEQRIILQTGIMELVWSMNLLDAQINQGDNQLTKDLNSIIERLEVLREANTKLKALAINVQEKIRVIKMKLEETKEKEIRTPRDNNEETKKLMEEIESYLGATENHNLDELIEISEANTEYVKESIKSMMRIKSILSYHSVEGYPSQENVIRELVNTFQSNVSKYNQEITYHKWKLDSNETGETEEKDNRKESAEKARDLSKEAKDKDIVIPENLQETLPSKEVERINLFPFVDFDFHENGTDYSQDTLRLLRGVLEGVNGLGEEIRDELYINEYIVGTFKSKVTEKEGFGNNLRNQPKKSRTAFFDSEVEYILYGNPSQQENLTAAQREILMIRFVINLITVYSDPQLLKSATILASSLAAPLGPAAMPLFKTLILCGWAMNYSIEDVESLLEGKLVNFYRNKNQLKLSYEDYLRVLLLRSGFAPKTKLNRIKDLVQLNLQVNSDYGESYRINKSNTYIKLDLNYSIKVLFQILKGETILIENTPNYYKLELWQGY